MMDFKPLVKKPKYGIKYEFNDLGFGDDVVKEIYTLWDDSDYNYFFDSKSGSITMPHNCWNKHILNKEIIIVK